MQKAFEDNKSLFLVAFVVFLTRIPFLFSGYGSEEDAWGLILTARNINLTGIYEVSRLPGHPVQEYLLSLIWDWPAWVLNMLTAAISTTGVFFFMKALLHLKIRNAVTAGVALSFVPVFYINSTNIMDYTWSLSLVLFAFYLLVSGKYIYAGVVFGISCGFRITAGAMIIPFALWHFMNHRSLKAVFVLGMATVVTGLICFLPAFYIYGTGFFTYYEYFPYPPFLKVVYKGTIGAWGVLGTAALLVAVVVGACFTERRVKGKLHYGSVFLPENIAEDDQPIHQQKQRIAFIAVALLCLSTILLYTYSYLKIPQKSAFILPMAPFIMLLITLFLNRRQLLFFTGMMVMSSFFLGVNLDDPIRGSASSGISMKTEIGQNPVSIDLLSGPVIADFTKRKLKMEYAVSVVDRLRSSTEKILIIAGWWQNELNYFAIAKPNPLVKYIYYASESQLKDSVLSGYKIYFLPEQDFYNDLRFKDEFTDALAKPF